MRKYCVEREWGISISVTGKENHENKTKTTCENTKQLLAGKDGVMSEKRDEYANQLKLWN